MPPTSKPKPRRAVPAAPPPRFQEWHKHALWLAAIAVAVYANSIGNGFVGDDQFQLLKNPLVTGPGTIRQIFGSGVWSFLGLPGNYYRPLQTLFYRLLYDLAGFQAPAFHLVMVLMHAASSVLVYLLVARMASARLAFAATALFAVHPIHTEVVDWAAALPDLLATTLVLAGVLLLARQNGAPRGVRLLGHCAIYLLALLSKETGAMMLLLYAGFGFFCLGRRWREFRLNLRLYAAMAAVFAVYLAIRAAALGGLAPARQFIHLDRLSFALSVPVTAARYLWALLYPVNLNYFHVFRATRDVNAEFLVSALVLGGLAALLLRSRIALLSYGIFWIAAAIAPTLNLTGVGQNVFAERYLYLPSVGFCWIAAWAWERAAERRAQAAKVAGAALLAACAFGTMARNRDWRDNFTMMELTARQSPEAGWIHDALASEYVARNAFGEALEHERLAVRYDPDYSVFHLKLGYLLMSRNPAAGIAEFRKVVALEPSSARSHYELAMALEAAGQAGQAAGEYRKTLELQPDFPEARERWQRIEPRPR